MNKYYVFARYRLPDYMRPDNRNPLWLGQEPAAHSLEKQGGETCPWLITITLALVFCLVGCASPIGVKKVGMRKAYQGINANVLNGEGLSKETKIVLHRFDLLERLKKDSAASIAFIHKKAIQDTRSDLRFALAELCYSHGEKLQETVRQDDTGRNERAADYFLMSAIYAYQYLFSSTTGGAASPYDQRFRVACDLYNRALGKGLATGEDGQIEFQNGVRRLPVGRLAITLKSDLLAWPLENFHAFLPADDYAVRGLSVRNRTAGIGLPLVALHRKTLDMSSVPITAFLRVSGDVSDLDNGSASATLELYSAYEGTDVIIKGRNVPLETDSTTPLAYKLEGSGIWMLDLRRFIIANRQEPELLLLQPYQAGRIPVVFVHGTVGSPIQWAEMWNTLRSDPVLRKRYRFWFFTYNSSVPVTISAAALRKALSEMVANLDPEGKDPALQQMVVVGHSQGGLLAKLSVVNTGSTLWWTFTDHSLEDLKAEPEIKARLREYFFIEPLPLVTRVVYISTPHRGSFLAKSWVRNLVRHFVRPTNDILIGDSKIYGDLFEQFKLPSEFRDKIPTSVDSMSPQNPLLLALSDMPVAPGVKAHSIIAVKGDKDPATGNDGVVEYTSAHQKGVQSEFVVRANHLLCQGHPLTIEEVRRILLSHLASLPGSPGLAGQRE